MSDHINLQHRCQRGEPSVSGANNLLAECHAALGRLTAERDALQALLTAADEENDALKGLAVKQAALLDELGIPLDEVDDLFGETLKNAKRYEYVRSVMAVENFPAPHPAWSEPSEVESKRIDDLCDAALKPAEGQLNQCDGCQAGIPVVNGAHRMGKPGAYPDTMSCTAKLYKP